VAGVLADGREQRVTRSKFRRPAAIGLFALILAGNGYLLVKDWLSADREWWEVGLRLFVVAIWALFLLRAIKRPRARFASE
jgi:hypothetical protein